jgi:hypothetical protein
MNDKNNQTTVSIDQIRCSSKEIHEYFCKVRLCYKDLLYIIREACVLDVKYAQRIFCVSNDDAYLLKQQSISTDILDETLNKNDHLFNFSFPKKSTDRILSQKVHNYYFIDENFISLVSRYREAQRSICIYLKEIVNISPVIAQQLFNVTFQDIKKVDDLCIVEFVAIAERHHWLIKFNENKESKIFTRSAELRHHSRGIVDTVLNS